MKTITYFMRDDACTLAVDSDELAELAISRASQLLLGDCETVDVPGPDEWAAEWKELSTIKAHVLATEPIQMEDRDDQRIHACFIGTLINPSGKYYVPFACSNVAGDCPVCQGANTVPNPRRVLGLDMLATGDHELMAQLRRTLSQLLVKRNLLDEDTAVVAAARDALFVLGERWEQDIPCPACGGCGSMSAAIDADWFDWFEAFLAEADLWFEQGLNGDPCDYFICAHVADGGDDD